MGLREGKEGRKTGKGKGVGDKGRVMGEEKGKG